MRRRGFSGFLSVAQLQQFADRLTRTLALAHFDQRTDEIAHHVAQEGGRFDCVNQQLTAVFV